MSKLIQHKFSNLYGMSSGISSKPNQAGHGSPFVSFKTVFNNYFLPNELPDLMDTSENEQFIFSVKEGDIFLTRTSETLDELGMSAIAVKDYPQATYSGFLKRLRPIKTGVVYHKYMAFYLRSKLFRKTMNNNAIMTLRASLNEQIFSYLSLLLPPFEEQKQAGDLLFLLHEKIELNNRINTELEQMAKTLYDYWFVQFDFPDDNGKPYKSSGGKMKYNEVLKREIPENWEIKKLGDFVNCINTGLNPRNHFKLGTGDNYYITIKNIEYGRLIKDTSCDRISNQALERIQQRSKLSKGDILFTSIEPVGKTFLLLENPKNWNINESVFNFKPNYNVVTSEYLFMLLSSEEVKLKCKNTSTGSIHKGIRITPLKEFDFTYPSKTIINSFTEIIKPVLERIDSAQQQNLELASLRDWLLPMLMNGQVRVSVASQEYSGKEQRPLAAEPTVQYEKTVLHIPENRKSFAKQVLAGKIVSVFKDDPNFTDIKFQKIQFLAEHVIEADLNLNYYYQAAGPYDNKFMHTIYNDFRKQKWFDCQSKRFIPLEKQEKIEDYYQGYFATAESQLEQLFRLLYQTTEAEAEIIATIYAVWNNRIIEKRIATDEQLIHDFYQWSDRKQQYSETQIREGIKWLRKHQMEPKGFGKLIKRARIKN